MTSEADPDELFRGAKFVFDDETTEVVFELADGRVLTVREYPTRTSFERAVADAAFDGTHAGIASLPDVDTFQDLDV